MRGRYLALANHSTSHLAWLLTGGHTVNSATLYDLALAGAATASKRRNSATFA